MIYFFIRAKHDLNFHNLRSKFLIVAQQLLNCQSSIKYALFALRVPSNWKKPKSSPTLLNTYTF